MKYVSKPEKTSKEYRPTEKNLNLRHISNLIHPVQQVFGAKLHGFDRRYSCAIIVYVPEKLTLLILAFWRNKKYYKISFCCF